MEGTKMQSDNHAKKLQTTLAMLQGHRTLCDLTIEVKGGKEYAVHKVVLVSHSKFFKNQLDHGTLDGDRHVLPGIDVDAFAPLLHFLYTGELSLTSKNVNLILAGATQLDIVDATALCERFLLDHPDHGKNYEKNVEDKAFIQDTDENIEPDSAEAEFSPPSVARDTFDETAKTVTKKGRGRPKRKVVSVKETGPISEDVIDMQAIEEKALRHQGRLNYTSKRRKRKKCKTKVQAEVHDKAKISDGTKDIEPNQGLELEPSKNKKSFLCPLCGKIFSFYSQLEFHKRIHVNQYDKRYYSLDRLITKNTLTMAVKKRGILTDKKGLYNCYFCQRPFRYRSLVKFHIQMHHIRHKKCQHCSFSSVSCIKLYQHQVRKHNVKRKLSRNYRCHLCSVSCKHQKSFLRHIISSHNCETWCEMCKKTITVDINRDKHLVHCYNARLKQAMNKFGTSAIDKSRKCLNCKKSFKYNKSYSKHIKICVKPVEQKLDKNMYNCKICNKGFVSTEALKEHQKTHHNLKVTQTKKRLSEQAQAWYCEECDFNCNKARNLMRHVKNVHPNISIPCPECRHSAGSRKLLEWHRQIKHKQGLQCELCDKRFSAQAQLRVHKVVKHKVTDPSVQVHSCPAVGCSYSCVWKSSLKVHMHSHQLDKPYACKVCDRKFKREKGLEKHMNTIHKGIRPYMCDVCGQSYGEEAELKAHMTRHGSEKQFKCDQCPYATHDKGNFQSHMFGMHKVISSPKMAIFTCNVCDYSTDRKHRYEMHMKTHMGIRDIVCPVCSKTFITKNTLSNHMQRIHSEKTYTCAYCQYTTGNHHTYKEHIRVMHTHRNIKPYKCAYCDYRCHTSGNCRKHCANKHKGLEIKWVRLCELKPKNDLNEPETGPLEEKPVVESNIKHIAIAQRVFKDVPKQKEGENLSSTRICDIPSQKSQHSQKTLSNGNNDTSETNQEGAPVLLPFHLQLQNEQEKQGLNQQQYPQYIEKQGVNCQDTFSQINIYGGTVDNSQVHVQSLQNNGIENNISIQNIAKLAQRNPLDINPQPINQVSLLNIPHQQYSLLPSGYNSQDDNNFQQFGTNSQHSIIVFDCMQSTGGQFMNPLQTNEPKQ